MQRMGLFIPTAEHESFLHRSFLHRFFVLAVIKQWLVLIINREAQKDNTQFASLWSDSKKKD